MSVPTDLPFQIDQTSFLGGYAPNVESAATYSPTNGYDMIVDGLNVVPDTVTGSVVTRKGFRRITDAANLLGGGYQVRNVFSYTMYDTSSNENLTRVIIAVLTNFTNAANNIQIWAYDLLTDTASRIDTAGRTWAGNGSEDHWQVQILGTVYGGQRLEPIYSWTPTGGWNADVSTPNLREMKNAVDGAINSDNQYGRDFAFSDGTRVGYRDSTNALAYYVALRDMRFITWTSGDEYERGDKVSLHQAWGHAGTSFYWKSFRCIKANTADATNRPGNGTGSWRDYWQPLHLELPLNDGDEVSDDWDRVPVAYKSGLATVHADRLWLRGDSNANGTPNPSRLQFSAPVKPAHGKDIGVLTFDPTNYAPDTTLDGDGGGWIDFTSPDGDKIQALWSTSQYLLVFKRRSSWVVSGFSEQSWTVRQLAHVGATRPGCVAELNGLVYFLNDEGLYVTDGTQAMAVPGLEKFRDFIKGLVSANLSDADHFRPQMWTFGPFVWMTLPVRNSATHYTLIYHPDSQSLYALDLPVVDACVSWATHEAKLYLAANPDDAKRAIIYQYDHASANDQDDTGLNVYAGADIPWNIRTPWYVFGVHHEERRIRRTWALVKGNQTFTLKGFTDYSTSAGYTATAATGTAIVKHIEGQILPDAHSIQFRVSGVKAPASVLGVSVITEQRRDARSKVP